MNNLFSWGTVIVILICYVASFIQKFLTKKRTACSAVLKKTNIILWHSHKYLGELSILLSLIHCSMTSRTNSTCSTLGALLVITQILLAFTYLLRKLFKKKWIIMHRILSLILMGIIVLHIIVAIF